MRDIQAMSKILLVEDNEMNRDIFSALTAPATFKDQQRALEVGCDDYVTKPIEFVELLKKIGGLAWSLWRLRYLP